MRNSHNFLFPLISFTLLFGCSRHTGHNSDPINEEVLEEKYVHKYGVEVPPAFWESSGEDGAVVSTRADGVVVSRAYKAGILQGETSYTFPHSSQVQIKEIYNQGRLERVIELYSEGSPKSEKIYNVLQGGYTLCTWYVNGAPRSIEQCMGEQLVDGKYFAATNQQDSNVENGNGTRLIRDDYGLLIATDTIVDGYLFLRQTYHPNNLPKERIPYQNNQIHGCKQTFLPAGEPNTLEAWVNGKQEGSTTLFFQGEKYADIPYSNGMRKGVERRYRDGNQLSQEITWENDQLHGPSTTYVGDEAAKTEWYYQGTPTNESNFQFMTNRPMVR